MRPTFSGSRMNCGRFRTSCRGCRDRACRCVSKCLIVNTQGTKYITTLTFSLFFKFYSLFCVMYVADVLAERHSQHCSDGPGECCAARGDAQHAGPGGLCRAPTEQHPATTCCPATIPATNTPAGTEHSTLTGLCFPVLFIKHISFVACLLRFFQPLCFRSSHLLCFCVFQSQRSSLTLQSQQNPLPASLYNTMMIPQQSPANVVQIATSLAQNTGPNTPAVATFAQDRAAQIRFASLFENCHSYILFP